MQAIIYFGMIDGETESPALGLLDADCQPKPAWVRLKKLIKEDGAHADRGSPTPKAPIVFAGSWGNTTCG